VTFLAVVTTIDSRERALALAHALVERRLAACVQLSDIESVYRWDGVVRQDREVRLLCKTTGARYAEVESAIRELHSYELPAIHAVALDQVESAYGAWIDANTGTTWDEPS
jgi:periplasmic divalent cation tolerance protein